MSWSTLYDIISNVDNISNDIPDKIIDSFADCNNWSLKIRHGIAILSFLMENDQLADLDQDVEEIIYFHKNIYLLSNGLQDVCNSFCLVQRHPANINIYIFLHK